MKNAVKDPCDRDPDTLTVAERLARRSAQQFFNDPADKNVRQESESDT